MPLYREPNIHLYFFAFVSFYITRTKNKVRIARAACKEKALHGNINVAFHGNSNIDG